MERYADKANSKYTVLCTFFLMKFFPKEYKDQRNWYRCACIHFLKNLTDFKKSCLCFSPHRLQKAFRTSGVACLILTQARKNSKEVGQCLFFRHFFSSSWKPVCIWCTSVAYLHYPNLEHVVIVSSVIRWFVWLHLLSRNICVHFVQCILKTSAW